jgi:hypothetical protein
VTSHLRQAVLAVTAVLALAVVCAVAWTPRPRAEAPPPQAPPRAPAPAERTRDVPYVPPSDLRNVFEFEDRALEAPAAPPPVSLAPLLVPPPLAPMADAAPANEPIRLVGFVRRGGVLRAALSFTGMVSVLGPGDEAEGYSVLEVDEDTGVTVRTPDGSELLLRPPHP